MNLWAKIVKFFKSLIDSGKKLIYVVYTDAKKSIADVLNDPELQNLALEAVKQAALSKLQGNDAWEAAYAQFKQAVLARGRNLGTAVLETVLQNVYVVFKFTEVNGVGQLPGGTPAELPAETTPEE